MKLLAVGDVHGRSFWKDVLAKEQTFDKFVFIGDYFDNFPPMTPERILTNFKEILKFKSENKHKVVLLIGNHELHYMKSEGEGERYSGWNEYYAEAAGKLLQENRHLFKAAHQEGNVLFTHSGVTNTWFEKTCGSGDPNTVADDVSQLINIKFETHPEKFRFSRKDASGMGEHKEQGCMWVRPNALVADLLSVDNMIQVVGHTFVPEIRSVEGKLVMIDCPKAREYLKIEDAAIAIGKL